MDNKLSIHSGEDRTELILFASRRKIKKSSKTKHSNITYVGCILDEKMSGESMALKVINKNNSRLTFLHRKNNFLAATLHKENEELNPNCAK